MPARGSSEVAQRRFWNMLTDKPGIIYIGRWTGTDHNWQYGDAYLTSDTGFVVHLSVFENGPIVFPPEHKLARIWKIRYRSSVNTLGPVEFDGGNEFIFKPYSTDFRLMGDGGGWEHRNIYWTRGEDWKTANLFFDSSPYAIPTSLHYIAFGDTPKGKNDPIAPNWVYDSETGAEGWGDAGRLYGYLNDVYFGNNEMGGNKPSVGVRHKGSAVGDLSKTYEGLWGCFGISHGICTNSGTPDILSQDKSGVSCVTTAEWTFDLCYRPQMMAMSTFNNQVFHLNTGGDTQSEGWGTDIVAIHEATVEFNTGEQETYRQFTVDVSPARSTMNVYTLKGQQLTYGVDYVHDDCDRSGRSYRLLDTPITDPADRCDRPFALIVTYLIVATTLHAAGDRKGRVTDTNVGSDRRSEDDVRGL